MPQLPTGTVTFLFTDIEGSTERLRRLGDDAYRRAQDDHAAIIRSALADHGGVEVRTVGDGFFAVFASANDAVRTAVDAQRGLAAHPWPAGAAIRVRMGMHTGEGILGGDDYVGIDVNRAARVGATGHGGQIVLSDATRVLVEDSLPDATAVRSLGSVRLKDFDEPAVLFDLVVDGLPVEFPPLRSLDAPRTNLRTPRTSIVGRDAEVGATIGALARARLVTLTGPGGTGKTRLALEVARRWIERSEDEVYVADLSLLRDPSLIVSEIAGVLRVRDEPGTDLRALVQSHLRERDVLLVLDNLEQLIDGAGVVGDLLDEAPALRVLATSRIPLRLAGELELPVAPLALPADDTGVEGLSQSAAVRLFVERATAIRPDMTIDGSNADAIGRIVASLDGLPLALELGASQLRVLGVEDLADRLERHLPLTVAGPRDAPDRQRTLDATIAWSVDTLTDGERMLFEQLSLFAGGWSLEAAEAVVDGGPDALTGLGSLIDQSLVRRTAGAAGTRYVMLETIHSYAAGLRSQRPAAERAALEQRHAAWYRELAEMAEPHLVGEEQLSWLATLSEEHDNLRALFVRAEAADDPALTEEALRAAAAIWRFWLARGRMSEGRAYLERLLALPSADAATAARALAMGALGSIEYWLRDYGAMQMHYAEQVEIARALGDRRLLAAALFNSSFVHVPAGDFAAHRTASEEALAVADPDDHRLHAQLWVNIGVGMMMSGDAAGAIEPVERAIQVFRAGGDRLELCETVVTRAGVAYVQGDMDAVVQWMGEAVEIATSMPSWQILSRVLLPAALLANAWEQFERTATLLGAHTRIEDEYDVHFPAQLFGDPEPPARAALGDAAFERAFEEGRTMSEAEVAAFLAADG